MSRIIKPLTNTALKNFKPLEKEYIKSDGNGLYIRIRPNGSKKWYFSYKLYGQLKKVFLGAYPDLSLEVAREITREYRGLLAQDIDPITYKEEQSRVNQNKRITLKEMALIWHQNRIERGQIKLKTAQKSFRGLELHVFPVAGDWLISDVTLPKLVKVLRPLDGSNSLYKINISLRQIFELAADQDIIAKNPLKNIHNEFKYRDTVHQPTISPDELPNFFRTLNNANIQKPTALLIEWQLLTVLRPREAVSIEWADVDFVNCSLHIPAERMKGGKRSHDVPLSRQAMQVLEKMKQYSANRKYIFSSYTAPYNKPMSSQTANCAITRMGYKNILVAHGLRSIASTYLHDLDVFSVEAIELCLAHENKNKVRAAYDKSKKWKSRQQIMQTWGDFVENCKIEALRCC